MRKFSFLTFLTVVLVLGATATASAADRYAAPTQDGSEDPDVCAPEHPCSLEVAMNPAKVGAGDNVRLAPGTYNVTTPLVLTASGSGIRGSGSTAAQTVINSNTNNNPALLMDNGAEAERLTINATGSFSEGIDIADGLADHMHITASQSNACIGTRVTLTDSLCRATGSGPYVGFLASVGDSSFTFTGCTLIGASSWYGGSFLVNGAGKEMSLQLTSTIVYGNGMLRLESVAGGIMNFLPEYSNYGQVSRYLNGSDQGLEAPTGDNQADPPLFTNAAAGDYTQAPGSPTINAGTTTGRSGSKDLAGNARVIGGAADIGAYESSAIPVVIPPPTTGGTTTPPPADTTKPTLKITKKPKSKTTSKKVSVSFTANETATFQCKLDKGKFKPCTSPYKKTVKFGKHKLQIKAIDSAGNASAAKSVQWEAHKLK